MSYAHRAYCCCKKNPNKPAPVDTCCACGECCFPDVDNPPAAGNAVGKLTGLTQHFFTIGSEGANDCSAGTRALVDGNGVPDANGEPGPMATFIDDPYTVYPDSITLVQHGCAIFSNSDITTVIGRGADTYVSRGEVAVWLMCRGIDTPENQMWGIQVNLFQFPAFPFGHINDPAVPILEWKPEVPMANVAGMGWCEAGSGYGPTGLADLEAAHNCNGAVWNVSFCAAGAGQNTAEGTVLDNIGSQAHFYKLAATFEIEGNTCCRDETTEGCAEAGSPGNDGTCPP